MILMNKMIIKRQAKLNAIDTPPRFDAVTKVAINDETIEYDGGYFYAEPVIQ